MFGIISLIHVEIINKSQTWVRNTRRKNRYYKRPKKWNKQHENWIIRIKCNLNQFEKYACYTFYFTLKDESLENLITETKAQVKILKNQIAKLESELKDSKVNSYFNDSNENL